MDKLGFIVDGQGEYSALKKKFEGKGFKVLKTDGPRGHTAPISKIIGKSKKQIGLLRAFGCSKIVVLLDFENRNESYKGFRAKLQNEFDKKFGSGNVFISIPNQMIENWFLADISHLSAKKIYLKDKLKQKKFEGKHGKQELKKLFKKKYSYNEVKHGVELFQLIRFDVAEQNSESFQHFLTLIA